MPEPERQVLHGLHLGRAGGGDLVGGPAGPVERRAHLVPDQRDVPDGGARVAQLAGQSPAGLLDLAARRRQRERGVVHDVGELEPQQDPEHEQDVADHLAGTTDRAVGVELHAAHRARGVDGHARRGGASSMALQLGRFLMGLTDQLRFEPVDEADPAVVRRPTGRSTPRDAALVWEPRRVVPMYAVPRGRRRGDAGALPDPGGAAGPAADPRAGELRVAPPRRRVVHGAGRRPLVRGGGVPSPPTRTSAAA